MAKRTRESLHQDLLAILRTAIGSGLNVLIEGPHGCGKTSMVRQAAEELGLRLTYFSTSTLDPFVDLVGLPVPTVDGSRRLISYHRNADILDCDVLFFDELNRAHPKTLNAVLEIIQFGTINGERLPRLLCVVAACNPPDSHYRAEKLDPALVDRFHLHIPFNAEPDPFWFEERLGPIGKALCSWYSADLDEAQRKAVTPRKLEHLGELIKVGLDPALGMASETVLPYELLQKRLESPKCVLDIEDFVADPSRYGLLVGSDLDTAYRFAFVLPTMRPEQIVAVRDVILDLPAELLARLDGDNGMKQRILKVLADQVSSDEAEAFAELWQEKVAV